MKQNAWKIICPHLMNQILLNMINFLSVPMNKIVVGSAPSPNLMSAQSRIGSLSNTQHKVFKTNKIT